MSTAIVRFSRFLSLVLRHQPEKIGLKLDSAGWADVQELLCKAQAQGVSLTPELLAEVVRTNDKKRFVFSADRTLIRASQGHSIPVDLQLPPLAPPEWLYHGTATRFLDSIRTEGILPGQRQHVHLSAHIETALQVGRRHGRPAVLTVAALRMHEQGFTFYRSANGVWLTARVPVEFVEFPANRQDGH